MRPVIIVDENCSFWLEKYIQDRRLSTLRIADGRPDNEVIEVAKKTDAYVITKDKGFKDYKKAIIIQPRDTPGFVYRKLREKMIL